MLYFVENKIFAAGRPKDQGEAEWPRRPIQEDAVKGAAPFVENSFKDQPAIEQARRRRRENIVWYLAKPGSLPSSSRRPAGACATHRGPDHPDTLLSMNNLANSYFMTPAGTATLSAPAMNAAGRQPLSAPDHPDTLASMKNLANVHGAARPPRRRRQAPRGARLAKAKLGVDHPDTLNEHEQPGHEPLRLRAAMPTSSHEETLAAARESRPAPPRCSRHPGQERGSSRMLRLPAGWD